MLGYTRNAGIRDKSFSKRLNNLGSIIQSIGNFGIVINKKVLDNKVAIPEDPRLEGDIYSMLDSFGGGGSNNQRTSHPQYNQSDQILRQARRWNLIMMSKNPELEDVVETLTDEVIVYDKNATYCCSARLNTLMLDEKSISTTDAKELEEMITDMFPKLYRMLGFYKSGAKKLFQEWLVEGKKAWEIVYDSLENPKKIIGMVPIDPLSLIEHWDEDGNRWYIQEPNLTNRTNMYGIHGNNTQQRTLHDSQIVFWDWDASGFKFSYLERLIRAFNIYRAIERMKINWWVMNSQFRTQIIIPTHGKSRQRAAETLSAAMQRYRDHVEFSDVDGSIKVNGSVNIPANKEYWLADTTAGKPEISQVGGEGYDLSSADTSTFKKNLLELTKLPLDRFDPSSSDSWNIDPTSAKRQELKTAKFVQSLRTSMSEIILKPLIIQICLTKPNLINSYELLDAVVIDFLSENIFSQKIEMEVMNEKVEFIGNLMEKLQRTDSEGNVKPFFSLNFLVAKYDILTPEEAEKNEIALRQEEKEMAEYTIAQEEIKQAFEETETAETAGDNAEELADDKADGDKLDSTEYDESGVKQAEKNEALVESVGEVSLYEAIKAKKLNRLKTLRESQTNSKNIKNYRI